MKVLWFAPFPMGLLPTSIEFARRQTSHPSSWIVELMKELSRDPEIELHIAVASSGIRHTQQAFSAGVRFHVVRHAFPLSVRGFPDYLRVDVWTRYAALRKALLNVAMNVNPDLIHAHGTEYGYGIAALDTNVQSLISVQGICGQIQKVDSSLTMAFQARIESQVIRKGRHFGTRTEWASTYVKEINPLAQIHYLPEAVNPVFLSVDGGKGCQDLLFVGSVCKRKGIETIIDALPSLVSKFPRTMLRVIGGGEPNYIAYLKRKLAKSKSDNRVEWLGVCTPEKIAACHADATLLVHPSLIDNSPNSVAEAQASGLPVVASNVGGIPSMINDRVTGLLFRPGDVEGLRQSVEALFADSDLRKAISANARSRASKTYTPPIVASRTVEVYKSIVNEKRKVDEL